MFLHRRIVPPRLDEVCGPDDLVQQRHALPTGGVIADGLQDLIVRDAVLLSGQGGAGRSVEDHIVLLGVQGAAVPLGQDSLLGDGEIFCAVVEQGGQSSLTSVRTQNIRQLYRCHLDAQHVLEAAGLQSISHGLGQRHELLARVQGLLVDVPFHCLRH